MANLAVRGGNKTKTKPFPSYPVWDKTDEDNLLEALHSGIWGSHRSSSAGRNDTSFYKTFNERLEEKMSEICRCKYVLAVSSGSAALDIAVKALGIGEGDEVIVTPYTFAASATCILSAGARPVFADIEPHTWNMDIKEAEKAITEHTKAIVIVHFAGYPAPMDEWRNLADKYNLYLIEDAAHCLGGEWDGGKTGSFGDFGCFSFQSSKNVTCGEGGMITTNGQHLYKKAVSLHLAGRAYKGPWYQHLELGWNYRLTEFQAALACSQLEKSNELEKKRIDNANYLKKLLEDINGIQLVNNNKLVTRRIFHLFTFRYLQSEWSGLSRKRFIIAMNAEGIPCHEGYLYPLYHNPLFEKYGCNKEAYSLKCKEAERLCKESVWFHQDLFLGDYEDMEEISVAIKKIKQNIDELI